MMPANATFRRPDWIINVPSGSLRSVPSSVVNRSPGLATATSIRETLSPSNACVGWPSSNMM